MARDGVPEGVRWLVHGRVQGVGFRWFVLQAARRLGVDGDVRNLGDGAVEIRASGPSDALAALLREVSRGPAGARVDRVLAETTGEVARRGFEIRD